MASSGTIKLSPTNIYSEAKTSSTVLGTFSAGNAVQVIQACRASDNSNWYKVSYIHQSDTIESAKAKVDRTPIYGSTTPGPSGSPTIVGWLSAGDALTGCKSSGTYTYGTSPSGTKGYVFTSQLTIAYKRVDYAFVKMENVSITNDEFISSTPATITPSGPYVVGERITGSGTKTFNSGASVNIIGSGNGQYWIQGDDGLTYRVNAASVTVKGSETQAKISSNDVTPVTSSGGSSGGTSAAYSTPTAETYQEQTVTAVYQSMGYTDTNPDWVSVFNEVQGSSDGDVEQYDNDYYKKLGFKYFNALGYPPKYNMDIDLQYPGAVNSSEGAADDKEMFLTGRVMSKTYLSNPAILSICPGKVRMFPNLIGAERDNFMDAMKQAAGGNQKLIDKIQADDGSLFSGKLYHFEADTENYAYYVNALCRACAILLNIGEETAPWTGAKLKNFDYSYWAIRSQYNTAKAAEADSDGSIFRNFWNGLVKNADRIYTSLVEDTTYINFFLNGSETQVSESIQTGVSDGPLSGIFNTVNELANTINYFTGSGFTYGSDDSAVAEAFRNAIDVGGDTLNGIVDLGKNFINGGKVVLPKMVSGAEYGRSISCSTKFVSPYGDPYSVFLRCIVPVCHLLALALPKQLSDNMYTYPFLIKANQVGSFHVDLGVISNINVTRGGSEDTSWSADGLATEWDVQFEITPLVDELMMTGTNHPVLFCKNEHLIDYLGNFCGFDLLANNASTKAEISKAFIANKFTGIPRSIENRVTDTLFNKLAGLSKVAWGV